MQIEHIAGVCFTPRGTLQQQGKCPVCHSVLGQVIIHTQHILALGQEIFAHGTACIGGNILQGCQLGGGCGYHNGIAHGTCLFQGFHHVCHSGALLPDGNVDADHVLVMLIDDGVQGNGGLAGLPVADNQLTLSSADGDHGINGLDACLQGLVYGLSCNNAGSHLLHRSGFISQNGALAVNGLSQGIDHSAQQFLPYGNGYDPAGTLDRSTFLDVPIRAEHNGTYKILFQVQRHTLHAAFKLQQLTGHTLVQAVNGGDAVAYGHDRTHIVQLQLGMVMLQLLFDNAGYFIRA